jgi:hypothetical protein
MEHDLPKLRDRIPHLICADMFNMSNPEESLDDRDSPQFESEWLRVYYALAKLDAQCSPLALQAVHTIENIAFKAVYSATGAIDFTEFAPAVSDDFGLFARAVCHDFNDPWLTGLFSSYKQGVFPSSGICPDDTPILDALTTSH